MGRKKPAVIVFPLLTMPTSPPLGAAMLKGFVERELPEWRVKVLDLNLWTFERLFAALGAGQFQLDPRAFPEGPYAALSLTRAADAFRGKNDHEFYSRPDLYDQYAELFLRFTETYTQALADPAQQARAHDALASARPFSVRKATASARVVTTTS
jgi:hypothetical protein